MTPLLKRAPRQAMRPARAALAFVLAATLMPLAVPPEAYAAQDPPPAIYGTATVTGIAGHNELGPNAFFVDVRVEGGYDVAAYGGNHPFYNDHVAYCISPGAPYPKDGLSNWGRLDWAWNDVAGGIAWYKGVFYFSEISNDYGIPYQNLGEIYLGIRWGFEGWVKIVKSSAASAVSTGSPDHSLAGATYELRRASDGALADTLVTDASGEAVSKGLEPGSYHLKEVKAPPGFAVDAASYNVAVTSGDTAKAAVKDEPLVWLELMKSSEDTGITDGNGCYSLAGAVYGVYKSAEDAAQDKGRVAELVTDEGGYAKSPVMLPRGQYFVREAKAPKGYAKDLATYPVKLDRLVTRLGVKDRPQGSPVTVAVAKADGDTGSKAPQGGASLAGAEFRLDYFDGPYKTEKEARSSGGPTRTWTIRTDERGEARLDKSSLVAGSDALYHNSSGDVAIPLGTVVIREVRPPVGYLLPDPVPVSVQQITSDSELENVATYHAPAVPDLVKRGDIAITKFFDPTPEEDTGRMSPEGGIAFDFYASHQFEGSAPKAGVRPAFTLTTDTSGRADTKGIYIIKNAEGTYSQRERKGTDHGGIPYDTYLAVQRTAKGGFEKVRPFLVYVAEDGKAYDYLLQNGTLQTPLRVVKVDSETGKAVPYPASWQVIDVKTGRPVSMSVHYPQPQTIEVFTSDDQGRLTLPEKLPYGDYELHEVEAPACGGTGYTINPVNVPFTTADGYDWDSPLTVVFADAPAKGRITVAKTDKETGEAVPAATYVIQAVGDIYTLDGTLRAEDGEVVDTVTTDEAGQGASKELYLGHYDVIEAISPEGYALDTARHGVALEYADQTVAVVAHALELVDSPTTLHIQKVDALTGEAMAGVAFLIASDDGSFEEEAVTDEAGLADISRLPHGSYSITEAVTPSGYVGDGSVYPFVVDDQGLIEGKAVYAIEVKNVPIQVDISKRDIATNEELPGARLALYQVGSQGGRTGDAPSPEGPARAAQGQGEHGGDASDEIPACEPGGSQGEYGDALYEWVSTDRPYRIGRLEPGSYILHEDAAPAGYELSQDVAFTVEETGEVQVVAMYDERTPDPPKTPGGPGTPYDKTGFDSALFIAAIIALGAGGLLGLGMGIKRHNARTRQNLKAIAAFRMARKD